MKILITGGLGFIGARLGKSLSCQGYEVTCATRSKLVLPNWKDMGKVVQIDWERSSSLKSACKGKDVVIHAAGMNSSECFKNPEKALIVNGGYTKKIYHYALAAGVKQFIYLSSAHVYSEKLEGIINEKTKPANQHPYAISNLAGEKSLLDEKISTGMQHTIVRIANSFGSPCDANTNCWMLVANNLCKQAAEDRRMVLRSSGSVMRNFITMTDVVSAFQFLVLKRTKLDNFTVCNLGDKNMSIFELASKIKSIYQKKFNMEVIIEEKEPRLKNKNKLFFQSTVLENLGWKSYSDFEGELFDLITFCEKTYR